jgi:hypothetical protein
MAYRSRYRRALRAEARRRSLTASRAPSLLFGYFRDLFFATSGGDRGRPEPGSTREFFVSGTYCSGSTSVASWQTFQIPKSAGMVMLVAAGGGAGGGAGHTAATGSNKTGGGGGGGAAIASLLISTLFIPSTIYVQVACSSTAAGQITYVGDEASTSAGLLLASATGGAGAGGAGGTTTGGSAGAAGTVWQPAPDGGAPLYPCMGMFSALVGQAGAAGGADTPLAGGNITFGLTAGSPFTGGAGGGSASSGNSVSNGGAIVGAGLFPSVVGGTGAGTGGSAGSGGLVLNRPSFGFMACGGSGGGASATLGAGGAGGSGSYCSGGGGGGAGVTGGAGGIGGPGFFYMAVW